MRDRRPQFLAVDALCTILVNYNSWRHTATTARQLILAGHDPSRLIIVDNASQDGSPEHLHRLLPSSHHISNPTNLGFAAACNQGAEAAWSMGAPAILLLNVDTAFGPNFLHALLSQAPDVSSPAALSPEIHWLRPPGDPWFSGAWWGRLPGSLRHRAPSDPRLAVDVLWSTALLINQPAWQRTGPFNPAFFLYYEDMDWCRRATQAGVDLHITPDPAARIWHAVSHRTGGPHGALRRYHMTRSHLLFHQLHSPHPKLTPLLPFTQTALHLLISRNLPALQFHLQALTHHTLSRPSNPR